MSLRRWKAPVFGGIPNMIQDGDVSSRLSRRFGLKDKNPAPVLAPDVQPVVIVDDLTNPVDQASISGFGATVVCTAAAGLSSHCWFHNPGGTIPGGPAKSGLDVVVERAYIFGDPTAAADFVCDVGWGIETPFTEDGDTFFSAYLQSRTFNVNTTPPATPLRTGFSQEAASLIARDIANFVIPAALNGLEVNFPQPFVIAPGWRLVFQREGVLTPLRVTVFGHTRPAARGQG